MPEEAREGPPVEIGGFRPRLAREATLVDYGELCDDL